MSQPDTRPPRGGAPSQTASFPAATRRPGCPGGGHPTGRADQKGQIWVLLAASVAMDRAAPQVEVEREEAPVVVAGVEELGQSVAEPVQPEEDP